MLLKQLTCGFSGKILIVRFNWLGGSFAPRISLILTLCSVLVSELIRYYSTLTVSHFWYVKTIKIGVPYSMSSSNSRLLSPLPCVICNKLDDLTHLACILFDSISTLTLTTDIYSDCLIADWFLYNFLSVRFLRYHLINWTLRWETLAGYLFYFLLKMLWNHCGILKVLPLLLRDN